LKEALLKGLELQTVQPDKPFILRVDASDRAVGAALEQFADQRTTRPTKDEVLQKSRTSVPVAFCSRKLTPGQVRTWSPREKETYAIVLALQKWASWIGLQPLLVLTDHKSLEAWATEILDTPSGPAGRRARWHELLSKFDISVQYIPGKENVVADALSRWAYPASKAFADTSIHGSDADDAEMQAIIAQEKEEERLCRVVHLGEWVTAICKSLPPPKEALVEVVTRSGKGTTAPPVPGISPFENPSPSTHTPVNSGVHTAFDKHFEEGRPVAPTRSGGLGGPRVAPPLFIDEDYQDPGPLFLDAPQHAPLTPQGSEVDT